MSLTFSLSRILQMEEIARLNCSNISSSMRKVQKRKHMMKLCLPPKGVSELFVLTMHTLDQKQLEKALFFLEKLDMFWTKYRNKLRKLGTIERIFMNNFDLCVLAISNKDVFFSIFSCQSWNSRGTKWPRYLCQEWANGQFDMFSEWHECPSKAHILVLWWKSKFNLLQQRHQLSRRCTFYNAMFVEYWK